MLGSLPTGPLRDLLMALQYEFSLDERPYCAAAERAGLGVGEALGMLRGAAEAGVLKRVGYYFNYRSQGHKAALVAYRSNGRVEELAEVYRRDPLATHVYLRDHPVYDVWVVVKRPTGEELEAHVEEVASKLGLDYVILYSRRTLKLSVKYDLYRGISRSGPYSRVREDPPRPEDLGYPTALARLLRALPLEERPYRRVAERLGMTEADVVEAAREMLKAGVLGDPGAALDGHKAGFTENAMVVMEPSGDEEALCECAASLPFSTHVVLREAKPRGAWRHTCYFMVHAVSPELIRQALEEARARCRPRDALAIRSLADLKPGVVR